jgi:hypothetical protein
MAIRRALVVGPAAGLLGACAAWFPPPQSAALLAAQPAGLPPRVELDAVPFFPQTRFHCGPAALATVLVHVGFAASPEALAERVFVPAREGSLQVEMLAGARRAGALAVTLPGDIGALLTEVAAGTPVVVLLNLGLAIAPAWHYAVLVGHDLDARELILRSGTTRRETMALATFEHTWARGGHWAFVALPPGRLPVTVREADAVAAALGFERAAPSAAARVAVWSSLRARWPEHLTVLVGHGDASAALGDWPGAAQAFERAATLHDSAAAWHNLALARSRLVQPEAALAAARRALARAEAAEPAWRERALQLLAHLQAAR